MASVTNRGLWLSSFSSPLELIDLPFPDLVPTGSVVVKVLDTTIMPYSDDIHKGVFPQLKLQTPLVPQPSHVGHVHAVGSDAVTLKPGDLVYFHPFVTARDDADVKIIQGHTGGENPKAKKLAQGEWRDGSLQQYQRVPLENVFVLDENHLCKELGYTYADLQELPYYTMAVGALCEAACL